MLLSAVTLNAVWALGGVASIFLGMVAAGVSAIVVGRSKVVAENIDRLRELNETLTQQNGLQEKQIAALKSDLEVERVRSNKQDEELHNLRQLVQGIDAMHALQSEVQAFQDKLEESHAQLMGAILRGGHI